MKVINTKFSGLKIIQQNKNGDSRGHLRETYRKKIIKWSDLIFDYATTSKENVLKPFRLLVYLVGFPFTVILKLPDLSVIEDNLLPFIL